MESGIQVPLTRNPDPVLEIQNPQAGIQNPILSLITLHARVTDWLVDLNLLSLKSDQHQISPYNVDAL